MSLKNSYFIVGTDTDIGKTYVSSLLYKGLKEFHCSYYKPIQSGGEEGKAPDVEFLCKFNNINYSKEMEAYVFQEPLSPHLASEKENKVIDKEVIKNKIEENSKKFRFNIVEGAGGIYVPLIRNELTTYDLIKELGIKVILVTGTKVGTINHTMLTLEFLKSNGIEIHGVIFNKYTQKFYENDNIEIIKSMGNIENFLIIEEGCKNINSEKIEGFFQLD